MSGEGLFPREIDRRIFSAIVDLDVEGNPVAFIQAMHPGTLDSTDVHETVGTAIVALDETKALRAVEELDLARRTLTGQLPARTLRPLSRSIDGEMFAGDLQLGRGNAAIAVNQGEGESLPGSKPFEAGLFDRTDVNEHIFFAVITSDEAEALVPVEEFDDASAFANHLGRHLRARSAVETTTAAATIAAAETATRTSAATIAAGTTTAAAKAAAVTIAEATARPSTTEIAAAKAAAARSIAEAATAAVEVTATEIVALTAPTMTTFAATAAFPVKTHAPTNTRIVRPAQLVNHPERTGLRRHESGKDVFRSGATYRKSAIVRRKIACCPAGQKARQSCTVLACQNSRH
jgi:hypothetical protein